MAEILIDENPQIIFITILELLCEIIICSRFVA